MKHRRSSRVSSVLGWVAVGGIVVMSASLYMGALLALFVGSDRVAPAAELLIGGPKVSTLYTCSPI
jgi:hypothetical protein